MLQASNATTWSIPPIAKIAAFGTMAAVLAMMAFVTIPALAQENALVIVKILNLNNSLKNFRIIIKDIANHNQIVYVKNVQVLSGNKISVQAPITISGNAVNVCVQAFSAAGLLVNQQCQAKALGSTHVGTFSFIF